MKRNATVASLCLSVALMAFGVYAATQVNYSVNSTVSFSALEVESTWNAGAYQADGSTPWEGSGYVADPFVTEAGDTSPDDTGSWTGTSIVFTTEKDTVVYKITCKNDGDTDFYVHVEDEDNTLLAIADQLTVTVKEGISGSEAAPESGTAIANFKAIATVPAGQTYVWEITVTLTSFSKTLDATSQGTLALQFVANYTNS